MSIDDEVGIPESGLAPIEGEQVGVLLHFMGSGPEVDHVADDIQFQELCIG